MIDLHQIAKDMLENGKKYSQQAAQAGFDFIPTFIMYRGDGEVIPLPMPNYTKDREFHIGLMRSMVEAMRADGFVFIMEAWFHQYPLDMQPDSPDFVPPSRQPNREEVIIAHGMSRDGGQAGYCCKIKRRGRKLSFEPVENMTDSTTGKSMVAMMGAMFGEKAN